MDFEWYISYFSEFNSDFKSNRMVHLKFCPNFFSPQVYIFDLDECLNRDPFSSPYFVFHFTPESPVHLTLIMLNYHHHDKFYRLHFCTSKFPDFQISIDVNGIFFTFDTPTPCRPPSFQIWSNFRFFPQKMRNVPKRMQKQFSNSFCIFSVWNNIFHFGFLGLKNVSTFF